MRSTNHHEIFENDRNLSEVCSENLQMYEQIQIGRWRDDRLDGKAALIT